ncbi:MAG: TetR/AcrR family transcriptional regulator [Paludibacteraceae bacterium]|nr:TetR/AcrR family transcriptional regulator [Paludibacteraceae bacterium]
MVEDRRDKILLKALELYMVEGYANVSITDLQSALDMGRGTLYYYFKDKDELFQEVVDMFLIKPKHRALDRVRETATIPDMIDAMLYYLNQLQEFYNQVENKNINTSNVVTVMYTAYSRFPELFKKARRLYEHELSLWMQAIKNSMRAGEVRGDVSIETTAHMFVHIKDGWDPGRTGAPMNFDIFPEQYNYLYNLIKKHQD